MRLRSGKKLLQQQLAPPQRRSRAQRQQRSTGMPRQHATAPPPTLLSLPHELLGEVFKHLDTTSRKAVFQASRTIAMLPCIMEQAQLQIDLSVTYLPTLHSLQLLDRHTHVRCLTLSGTHRMDLSCMLAFLHKSSLEGSNERLLMQGVVELRLKGWSIEDRDVGTMFGALLKKLCLSVRTLHLESMAICSTFFGALAQVQELHIKNCFCPSSEGVPFLEHSLAKDVLPLKSLHTLCLDVKICCLSGVDLLPELRHLQLGPLYGDPDLDFLKECPQLESVTFLAGRLSLFHSATLKKLVCLPSSLRGYRNLSTTAFDLSDMYIQDDEEISLPALETFELEKACLSGGFESPEESAVSRARLARFMRKVSPHVCLDIKELLIQGRFDNDDTSLFEILFLLELLAGRFEVQQLETTIRMSDMGLQQLASLMPPGMQRVRLPIGSLGAACLASVVSGWHKLEVLELVGAYGDAGLVWSVGEALQRCPDRRWPLQVRLSSNFVDLCHSNTQWKQRFMLRWQQAALRFACSGRAKVQLYID